MPDVTILTEAELRRCVELDLGVVGVVERAFAALARGGVIMPPVLSMAIEEVNGEVDIKTAYLPGLDGIAVKVSPGFFGNPGLGLPSLNGLMVLLDGRTGLVKTVLLDNGYLTDVRTAAAGAVAAKHLAPHHVESAGIIGAGVQAELQIEALKLVRDFKELIVWARDERKAEAYAKRMADRLACPVRTTATAEQVVREAQVVVTATPARHPLILAEWLHPGLHITAMGSDAPEKNELDPNVIVQASRFVVDRVQQSIERGEMRAAVAAHAIGPDYQVEEVGELCAGLKPGRLSDEEITVCDLTGTGVQDTAIATVAFAAAQAKGLGTVIRN